MSATIIKEEDLNAYIQLIEQRHQLNQQIAEMEEEIRNIVRLDDIYAVEIKWSDNSQNSYDAPVGVQFNLGNFRKCSEGKDEVAHVGEIGVETLEDESIYKYVDVKKSFNELLEGHSKIQVLKSFTDES